MPKGGNQISDQVMSERPRGLDALLFQRDRIGLRLADPDRQIAITVGFAQKQNRLVLWLLDANADHTNLAHLCLPSTPSTRLHESSPHRSRTARTADLISDVCKVMASAATSRASSSALSRAPAFPALTTGPAIWAMRSDCRSAAERNARRCRGSTPYSSSACAHCAVTTECSSKNPAGPGLMIPALTSAPSNSGSTPERVSRSSRLSRTLAGATAAVSWASSPSVTGTNRGIPYAD